MGRVYVEIRNQKAEIRRGKKTRNQKPETRRKPETRTALSF
jgi:hypothetical protein